MKVVTAADSKFNPILDIWLERVKDCGLEPIVYNLGGLVSWTDPKQTLRHFEPDVPGFKNFRENGYYQLLADGTWKSRAVHKPLVVEKAIEETDEPILYLDMDAILRGVPHGMAGDWDVAVTVRPPKERNFTQRAKSSFVGKINAGVIWFNNTEKAKQFVAEWKRLTLEEGNDQRALNLLLPFVEVGHCTTILDGVRVMGVPTPVYNNYYTTGIEAASVVHLKNNEWKKLSRAEIYRRCMIPEIEEAGGTYYDGTDDGVYIYDDSGVELLDWLDMWTYGEGDDSFLNQEQEPSATALEAVVGGMATIADIQLEDRPSFSLPNDGGNFLPVDPSGS